MATYKVPQDVEADDKLLGPFSFRQFIYLIVAVIAGALSYLLGQLLLPLFIIPLPIAIAFLILALPLKKDQPMELYFAAILSFYLKPRRRIWQADGRDDLVEMTDQLLEKDVVSLRDLTSEQAQERLDFLSGLVDSEGWSIKNSPNQTFHEGIVEEANKTEDVHENSSVTTAFDAMIAESDRSRRQNLIQNIQTTQPVTVAPNQQTVQPTAFQAPSPAIDQILQTAPVAPTQPQQPIRPQTQAPNPAPAAKTAPKTTNPAIMNLANNQDLTIETIAAEANRINEQDLLGGQSEVVISLR